MEFRLCYPTFFLRVYFSIQVLLFCYLSSILFEVDRFYNEIILFKQGLEVVFCKCKLCFRCKNNPLATQHLALNIN
jgi:hypothetical protein